jgi:DNA-binding response OmpR family regulator
VAIYLPGVLLMTKAILIYGNDPQLVKTRQWVLEVCGYEVWGASNFSTAQRTIQANRIDLLMLCHSLSNEECGRAITIFKPLWPRMKIMVLTAEFLDRHSQLSIQIFDTMDGPVKLVSTLEKLIHRDVRNTTGEILGREEMR